MGMDRFAKTVSLYIEPGTLVIRFILIIISRCEMVLVNA